MVLVMSMFMTDAVGGISALRNLDDPSRLESISMTNAAGGGGGGGPTMNAAMALDVPPPHQRRCRRYV